MTTCSTFTSKTDHKRLCQIRPSIQKGTQYEVVTYGQALISFYEHQQTTDSESK